MAYQTGTLAGGTSPLPTLDPILTAAGFVSVDSDVAFLYSGSAGYPATANVYKSPAASNSLNQDWYLIVATMVVSGNRYLMFSVAESWDAAAHKAIRYLPAGNNVVPAGDFSIGPTAGVLDLAWFGTRAWADAGGSQPYAINVTPDRVIFFEGVPGATPDGVWYVGLFDPVYPATIEPVAPVGAVSLGSAAGSQTANSGATTREPGQTVAGTYNWRIALNSNQAVLRPLSALGGNADAITGRALLSPVGVSSQRVAVGTSLRALAKDLKVVQNTSSNLSDTLSETMPDGTTRNYIAVNANGVFMPTF